jgi:hypothetical protein
MNINRAIAYSPPNQILRAGKQNILLSSCFVLFISLYIGIILPAHHHTDGQEHSSCSLCLAQHQPSVTEIAFTIPVNEIFVCNAPLTPEQRYLPSPSVSYQTRAPPSLFCSSI